MTSISVIGLMLSVFLAIGLIILGVDKASSVIIGLLTTSISLLVDMAVGSVRMEERLVRAAGLSHELIKDPHLFATVSSIVGDYHRVTDVSQYGVFSERARDALSECKDTIHSLVEGYMIVPPLSPFSFGLRHMKEVRKDLKATSYVDAESFWNSVAGEKYFQSNVELVRQGVKITRIFIGDRVTLSRFKSIIMRHRTAGIRVLVALTDELPLDVCEDYLIADGEIVVRLELTREGVARSERISIDSHEVSRANNNFQRLIGAAHEYEEVFRE